jgi:hypothetical protein
MLDISAILSRWVAPRRVAVEWLIFIASVVFGFIFVPLVSLNGNYDLFFTRLASEKFWFRTWLGLLTPYFIVQAFRLTRWSFVVLKKTNHPKRNI